MTPKMVMFQMEIGDTPKFDMGAGGTAENVTRESTDLEGRDCSPIFDIVSVHHNKLEELIGELSASLTNVKHEQEFMEVRERIHRASES